MTISSSGPSSSTSAALRASDDSSGGASSGRQHLEGMRMERHDRRAQVARRAGRDRRSDDRLVAPVHAVEAADRDRPRDRLDVEQALADDHAEHHHRAQAAVSRLSDAEQLVARREAHRAGLAVQLEAASVARRLGLVGGRARGLEGAAGRPAGARNHGPVGSAETSAGRGRGRDVEVADRRSAKLEAVRARPGRLAEIGGDLAHVRALGALHRDRRPLSRLVEARDLEAPDRHMAGRRRHRLAPPASARRSAGRRP